MACLNSGSNLDNDDDFDELQKLLSDRRLAAHYFQMHPWRKVVCWLLRLRIAVARCQAAIESYLSYATAGCVVFCAASVPWAISVRDVQAKQGYECVRIGEKVDQDSTLLIATSDSIEELSRKIFANEQAVAKASEQSACASRALEAKLKQVERDMAALSSTIGKMKQEAQGRYSAIAEIEFKYVSIKHQVDDIASEQLPVGAIVAATKECKAPQGSPWLPADGRKLADNSANSPDRKGTRVPDVGKSFSELEFGRRIFAYTSQGSTGEAPLAASLAPAVRARVGGDPLSAPISKSYSFLVKVK